MSCNSLYVGLDHSFALFLDQLFLAAYDPVANLQLAPSLTTLAEIDQTVQEPYTVAAVLYIV